MKLKECGKSLDSNARIIGGYEVKPHTWPFLVLLLVKYISDHDEEKTYTMRCAGTLIDETSILTAAHCVFPNKLNQLDKLPVSLDSVDAYLGLHNTFEIESNTNYQLFTIYNEDIIRVSWNQEFFFK